MITLAIETTSGILSCALFKDDALFDKIHIKTDNQQQNLMPTIKELYQKTGINKHDTSLVCVDIGPGAFTALRIGVSTAKTLAHALNVPVIGVSTLDVLYDATLLVNRDKRFDRVSIIDARRSKLFTSIFFADAKKMINLDLTPDEILYFLRESSACIFAGIGIDEYVDQIKDGLLGKEVLFAPKSLCEPDSEKIGIKGIEKFKNGEKTDYHNLVPLYIRNSDNVTRGK